MMREMRWPREGRAKERSEIGATAARNGRGLRQISDGAGTVLNVFL